MRKKIVYLLLFIFLLALIFVLGSIKLIKNAQDIPLEESISLEELNYYLTDADTVHKDAFLSQCKVTLEEKGYLPKEDTMQKLITYMREKQPELELDYKTLDVVSVSENSILVQSNTRDDLQTYQISEEVVNVATVKPGKRLKLFGSTKSILLVTGMEETEIPLEAVWIMDNTQNNLHIKYGEHEFKIPNLDDQYKNYEDIADIVISGGGVSAVDVYTEKVNEKLLSIKNQNIELEDKGRFPYVENIQVYKLFGEYEPYTLGDLKIGYDFTDFVLNDQGEIVAALVTHEDYLDKIRVVVKNTNFESAYHEEVILCCDTDMEWKSGEASGVIEAGTQVCLSKENEMFDAARIIFTPVALSARTQIPSIQRNQGTPSYRGTIEIENTEDGLLIINELPLDEYLYSVVPSEMPASYPLEALKAQAVSARTYAYAHMQSSRLQTYGAHVDDSAAFQVYNNIMESEATTRAVRETEGVIVCSDGSPVTTYFYSTSCGYGTDLTAWISENEAYLQSKKIGTGEVLDLTENEIFDKYIKQWDDSCYEATESYFRWRYETQVDEEVLLENLKKRYTANPDQILTKTEDGFSAKDIQSFGKLKDIQILNRSDGGAITELLLIGSDATIKILSEKNVRYVLANENTKLSLGEGYTKEGTANGMLPSAFLTLDIQKEEDQVLSYIAWGGGFGHGIGMSQNGARQMANREMNFEEILQFFYVDTNLEKMKKESE